MQQFDLQIFSPAKINLFFRVIRKKEDGYHEIASLMQALNFGDTLLFSLLDSKEKDEFYSSEPSLIFNESNLIYRAIELFKKETGKKFSLRIKLSKNIPIGSGLGGGSSNAASTLFALDKLLKTNLSQETFKVLGKKLGADVPFFFSTGTCFCTGIGEILQEVPFKKFSLYLAKPKESLATPFVYQNHRINQDVKKEPFELLALFQDCFDCFCENTYNDLEKTAFLLKPSLFEMKKRLQEMGFAKVVMTGSGTTFLCFGNVEEPTLPGLFFEKVSSIRKKPNDWFFLS